MTLANVRVTKNASGATDGTMSCEVGAVGERLRCCASLRWHSAQNSRSLFVELGSSKWQFILDIIHCSHETYLYALKVWECLFLILKLQHITFTRKLLHPLGCAVAREPPKLDSLVARLNQTMHGET